MTERFDTEVTTTCGYCGVGCRLEAHAHDGRVVSITAAQDGPANKGHTCLKGRFAHQFSRSRERLTTPLIRDANGDLQPATWEEAITRIVSELSRIKGEHGPDAIAGLASSRATNEDCYALSRLIRAAIGTNNIDNCSRVCHSPTSWALRKSLGLSGATGSFDDIDASNAAIIIGANPTEGHPVVGARIKQATLRGLKLVTIDPAPDRALRLRRPPPLAAAGHERRGHARARPRRRPGRVRRCRVHRRADRGLRRGRGAAGPVQPRGRRGDHRDSRRRHRGGRAHLRRGRRRVDPVGPRRHRAPLRLRGRAPHLQPRADDRQGRAARVCAAPAARAEQRPGLLRHGRAAGHVHRVPVRRRRADRARLRGRWGVSLSREKGYTIPQMFDAAVDGRLKAMWIFGEDVAQTDPNTTHVIHALESLEFMVCQEIFENETTQVRRRRAARLGVPGEGGDVHQRRAPLPARRAGDRSARRREDRLRDHHHDLQGARPRHGLGDAVGHDGRDRGADPDVRRRQP